MRTELTLEVVSSMLTNHFDNVVSMEQEPSRDECKRE